MPQANSNLPSMNKRVTNVFYDERGNVILEIGATECLVQHSDGSFTKYRINENIQLACGTMFNAAMAMGSNPALIPAVCGICRRPCSPMLGGSCAGCGIFLCPHHARRDADGEPWCDVCACKQAVKAGLQWILFSTEDEQQ